MWSRVVEAMLGVWLVISPFVFAHSPENSELWINDLACGSLVILLALFSFGERTAQAHLVTLLVCGWLLGYAYWYGFPHPTAASQNHLVLALILLMFAIIPNRSSQPPTKWQKGLADLR